MYRIITNKMKNNKDYTVGTISKSIRKLGERKRGKLDTANTNIHHRSLQCLVQALQYTEQVTGLS
jgi:hypothetical protein